MFYANMNQSFNMNWESVEKQVTCARGIISYRVWASQFICGLIPASRILAISESSKILSQCLMDFD